MKFGVREICDVVFRAKANQKIGNKIFYKHEPVIYFDSLKTSTLEGAATTVYAQGGRGNARLVAWEGERTLTFTMEDALISPEGFSILSGAGLIDGNEQDIQVHATEIVGGKDLSLTDGTIVISQKPKHDLDTDDNEVLDKKAMYIMIKKGDEIISEPITGDNITSVVAETSGEKPTGRYTITINASAITTSVLKDDGKIYKKLTDLASENSDEYTVLVDYYVTRKSGAQQIEITADKFGGSYYVEASTLFRDTNGVDMPAEFVIPNAKIQSNFTFSMASSGDPSTFTFTMDAFPDYTRFDSTKKVMALIQIIGEDAGNEAVRHETKSLDTVDPTSGRIVESTAQGE